MTLSLTDWQDFTNWHTKSDPRDLWPLRHLIRVMRRHDLTNFDDNFWWEFLTILKISAIFDNFWFLRSKTIFDNFEKTVLETYRRLCAMLPDLLHKIDNYLPTIDPLGSGVPKLHVQSTMLPKSLFLNAPLQRTPLFCSYSWVGYNFNGGLYIWSTVFQNLLCKIFKCTLLSTRTVGTIFLWQYSSA